MACYWIPNLNTNGANLISVSKPVDWHQNLIMLSIGCQTLHAIKKIQGKSKCVIQKQDRKLRKSENTQRRMLEGLKKTNW